MCTLKTDRQAVVKPLEDWVISDKESLVAWVRRFLWHYEGVCSGNGTEEAPDEPEKIIVENILLSLGVSLKQNSIIEPSKLSDPETYFQGE